MRSLIVYFISFLMTHAVHAREYIDFKEDLNVIHPPSDSSSASFQMIPLSLNNEFKEKYQSTFGQDYERAYYHRVKNNMISEGGSAPEPSAEEQLKIQKFGNYTIKRIAEFHGERFFESQPVFRPALQVKKTVENIDVPIEENWALKIRYSTVGNSLTTILENPSCDSKIVFQMDPESFGPSEIQKSNLVIGKKLFKDSYLELNSELTNQLVSSVTFSNKIKRTLNWYLMNSNLNLNERVDSYKEIGMKLDY